MLSEFVEFLFFVVFAQKRFDSLSRSRLSSDMARELWEISETLFPSLAVILNTLLLFPSHS